MPDSPNLIMKIFNETSTAFVSGVRTTLILPGPAGPTVSYLPPRSSVGQLYSVDTNLIVALRGPQ